MPFSSLSSLAAASPLCIQVIYAQDDVSLTLAGILQPLRLVAQIVDGGQFILQTISLDALLESQSLSPHEQAAQIVLIVANDGLHLEQSQSRQLIEHCRHASVWGAVGGAVLWLAQSGTMRGLRTALPRNLAVEVCEVGEEGDAALLTPHLFELDGNRLSCCGGAASMDFALTLIDALFGAVVQAEVMQALCIEHVRSASDKQQMASQVRFASLQPKLSEALQLMEANLEEPLATDDIANLVGISRRQLERLFKQYLGNMPSRYYLELRLKRARQLLLESHHSIIQVGLTCGFSSGSHFATAYGTLFGITPREERQRKLAGVTNLK
jgi:transcriptional regulator GlxA family with amidase domain